MFKIGKIRSEIRIGVAKNLIIPVFGNLDEIKADKLYNVSSSIVLEIEDKYIELLNLSRRKDFKENEELIDEWIKYTTLSLTSYFNERARYLSEEDKEKINKVLELFKEDLEKQKQSILSINNKNIKTYELYTRTSENEEVKLKY